jgi:hypothetical protein
MRENSTVYFKTNVFLHDNPTNPLHQRISVEGKEPLWVAASNQVAYYQSSEMTNASIHARYLYSTNATLTNANIHASALRSDTHIPTYITPNTTTYGMRWEGAAGIHNKFGADGKIFYASPYNSGSPPSWYIMNTTTQHYWGVGLGGIVSNSLTFTKDGLGMTSPFRIAGTNTGIGLLESGASLNLTTGMTITATTIVGFTNEIKANMVGAHLSIAAANGSYPTVSGGHLLLTPGTDGPNNSRVKVTRGIFEADEIKTVKMGLAQVGMPGSEVLSAWLQSDGTNLFFVSTVPPGFTNALTTNAP